MRSRSTLNVSPELVDTARKLLKVRTKTEAIEIALKEIIRKKRIEDLISMFGKTKIRRIPRTR